MTPGNAILLLRISDDKAGDAHGVASQERRGLKHAAKINWRIGRIIIENDTSAFKRRKIRLPDGRMELRTVRPGFRETLDLLASGANDGLLALDLDRAARDPRDLEDLIDVVEAKTPRIPVESVTGSLRLANDADITMARVMVAIANKASRDTSRRIADRQADLAAQGKPKGGGFRAYGYERDGMTVVPEEADVIKWMAGRILDEDDYWSLTRIADELTARRIPTATGLAKWSARTVSSILCGGRIAGLRVYKKQIVGTAVWPRIVDVDVWERVVAELGARDNGGRNNVLKRWLTGVLKCSLCGWQLYGWQNQYGPKYWCATTKGGCGKITIKAVDAEAEVERHVLAVLADPQVVAALVAAQQTVNAGEVRAELADDEAQLKELAGMWARKEITLAEYREARAPIQERIDRGQQMLLSSTPRAVRQLLVADDAPALWAEYSPAYRRDVVRALWAGYRVDPHPPGMMFRFVPERLVPIPHASRADADGS